MIVVAQAITQMQTAAMQTRNCRNKTQAKTGPRR
jgi:hypothetical protein